jgi:hypothetical protein
MAEPDRPPAEKRPPPEVDRAEVERDVEAKLPVNQLELKLFWSPTVWEEHIYTVVAIIIRTSNFRMGLCNDDRLAGQFKLRMDLS